MRPPLPLLGMVASHACRYFGECRIASTHVPPLSPCLIWSVAVDSPGGACLLSWVRYFSIFRVHHLLFVPRAYVHSHMRTSSLRRIPFPRCRVVSRHFFASRRKGVREGSVFHIQSCPEFLFRFAGTIFGPVRPCDCSDVISQKAVLNPADALRVHIFFSIPVVSQRRT